MSDPYRLNLRFDPDNADDSLVLDWIRNTAKPRSRVILDGLAEHIQKKPLTLEDIRQAMREELRTVQIMTASISASDSMETAAEDSAANDASVLEDLDSCF